MSLVDLIDIRSYDDEEAEVPRTKKSKLQHQQYVQEAPHPDAAGSAPAAAPSLSPFRPPAPPPTVDLDQLLSFATSQSLVASRSGPSIAVGATDFQTAIDCTHRALLAAQAAERVAMAASKAFGAEVAALMEVKHQLESIKMKAAPSQR